MVIQLQALKLIPDVVVSVIGIVVVESVTTLIELLLVEIAVTGSVDCDNVVVESVLGKTGVDTLKLGVELGGDSVLEEGRVLEEGSALEEGSVLEEESVLAEERGLEELVGLDTDGVDLSGKVVNGRIVVVPALFPCCVVVVASFETVAVVVTFPLHKSLIFNRNKILLYSVMKKCGKLIYLKKRKF